MEPTQPPQEAMSGRRAACTYLGQVLRQSDRREAAIFLHDGVLWVADFIDGEGALSDAATWVRFHCAGADVDAAQRRMRFESAIPLSPELAVRIEQLIAHRAEPLASTINAKESP